MITIIATKTTCKLAGNITNEFTSEITIKIAGEQH